MLQLGIIRPSNSPLASPLHLVPKATAGDWRLCSDYRALNNVTVPVVTPFPIYMNFLPVCMVNLFFQNLI